MSPWMPGTGWIGTTKPYPSRCTERRPSMRRAARGFTGLLAMAHLMVTVSLRLRRRRPACNALSRNVRRGSWAHRRIYQLPRPTWPFQVGQVHPLAAAHEMQTKEGGTAILEHPTRRQLAGASSELRASIYLDLIPCAARHGFGLKTAPGSQACPQLLASEQPVRPGLEFPERFSGCVID